VTVTELAGVEAPAAGPVVTEPGIYEMTAEQYHADPVPGGSLSSSGARKLLECPAKFDHERRHGRPPKKEFDFGHAAHKLVLGAGPELRHVKHPNLLTKAAKAERDAAYVDGAVPLLTADWEKVHAMADAIRADRVASRLLDPWHGRPEQALFWRDERSGVMRRALLDWLPDRGPGRMIVPDYKTTTSCADDAIEKTVNTYGYHQQAPWYLDGVGALDLAADPQFVFIFQEKTAPFLVRVVQLSPNAMRIGRHLNRKAIATWQACTASGQWPGYSDDIDVISLPAWAENKHLQEMQ
jgi:hypothetical protein